MNDLEAQRNKLKKQLEAQSLTEEQIRKIKIFTAEVRENLPSFRIDFNGRRKLIEMLDVQIRLTIEDGQKVVYAECFLAEKRLPIAANSMYNDAVANFLKRPMTDDRRPMIVEVIVSGLPAPASGHKNARITRS